MVKYITSRLRMIGLIILIFGLLTIIGGVLYSQAHFNISNIITLLGMILFLVGVGIYTYKIRPPRVTTQQSD